MREQTKEGGRGKHSDVMVLRRNAERAERFEALAASEDDRTLHGMVPTAALPCRQEHASGHLDGPSLRGRQQRETHRQP